MRESLGWKSRQPVPRDHVTTTAAKTSPKKWICAFFISIAPIPTSLMCLSVLRSCRLRALRQDGDASEEIERRERKPRGSWGGGGKGGRDLEGLPLFFPPLPSLFALSSPAELRLDWLKRDCSQSKGVEVQWLYLQLSSPKKKKKIFLLYSRPP